MFVWSILFCEQGSVIESSQRNFCWQMKLSAVLDMNIISEPQGTENTCNEPFLQACASCLIGYLKNGWLWILGLICLWNFESELYYKHGICGLFPTDGRRVSVW